MRSCSCPIALVLCFGNAVFGVFGRFSNPFSSMCLERSRITDRAEDEYQIPSSHPVCITQPPVCISVRIPNKYVCARAHTHNILHLFKAKHNAHSSQCLNLTVQYEQYLSHCLFLTHNANIILLKN